MLAICGTAALNLLEKVKFYCTLLCHVHIFPIFTPDLDTTIADWNLSKVGSGSCDSGWKNHKFVLKTRQQSDAYRFSRFQPTSSRLSRSRSDYDPTCIFRMVKNNRLCPDSVPISLNEIRQWPDSDPTLTARHGRNRDSVGNAIFFQIMPVYYDYVPINRIPSRHLPDSKGQCYDCDLIQQNLSRHSHDCNPTRRSQPNLPNGTGRTLLSGVIGLPSRPSRLCYEPSRLRPDNDRTFPIIPDSTPTFSFFVL